jgi:hypothetical protein
MLDAIVLFSFFEEYPMHKLEVVKIGLLLSIY